MAAFRNNLILAGDACAEADRFEEALRYYNKFLENNIEGNERDSIAIAGVYRRLAAVQAKLNNVEDALVSLNKGESFFRETGRTDHDEYALLMYERGMLFKSMQDYNKASDDFSTALGIQGRIFGNKHISGLRTRMELSDCQIRDENNKKSSILDIENDIFTLDKQKYSKDVQHFFELVGKNSFGMRLYDLAIDMMNIVIDLNSLRPNAETFHSRNAYHILGESFLMLSESAKALDAYKTMFNLERNFARDVFTFLPETKRASYWAACNEHMNSLFQLNRLKDSDEDISGLLYDAALFHKGLLLETTAGVAAIVSESEDEELKKEFNHLQNLKQQQLKDYDSEPERSEFLASEADRLERKVMERIRPYGDFMHFADFRWQDIRDALKENEIAIEFIASHSIRHSGVYYSAEILRYGDDTPTHLFLFSLSPFEQGKWTNSSVYKSHVLGQKIWSRILPYIKPGDTIYFSAAGDLHNTAIEYLKINDSTRINDIYTLHRLSSTRQILNTKREVVNNYAVLYGGLNYNTDPADMEMNAVCFDTSRGQHKVRMKDSGNHLPWGYLRGTRSEVDQIGQMLGNKDFNVIKYTGDLGIEESFKALTKQEIKVIHLATHGFFSSDYENSQTPITEDQSLMQSALILSGANNVWTGGTVTGTDDGILTAKEISLLDLQRTDMIVLSACQTGLGQISGEGVFGLQRGFKKAGAGTLLMSLWEVDDQSTQMMMTEFYKALLDGKSKQDALRHAQKQIMQTTFWVDGVSRSGSDPYFWASFILLD